MIDKLKEIQEILTSRFNNVIVGSLVISFVMVNLKGISIFILSDKPTKIHIIRNWQLDIFWDIVMVFLISSIYIIAVPYASAVLKKYITNRIYKEEQEAERDKLLISLNGMQDVAIATAKSTSEYAENFAKNEIQNWIDERERTLSSLESAKIENATLTNSNDDLVKRELAANTQLTNYSMLYERCVSSINNMDTAFQDIISTSPHAKSIKNKYGVLSSQYTQFIIEKLIDEIKRMASSNNIKPIGLSDEWTPPIKQGLSKSVETILSEILDAQKQKEAKDAEFYAALREHDRKKSEIPIR